MKLSSSFLTSSLALAAVALSLVTFAPSARAVGEPWNGVTSASAGGDLFVTFRTSATTGASVIVNIGSVFDLKVATESVYIGNFNAVLEAAYGATWSTSAVYWTVTGVTEADPVTALRTAWAGQAQLANGAHQIAKNSFANSRTGSGKGYVTYNYVQGGANGEYITSTDIQYLDTGLIAVTTSKPWSSGALGTGLGNLSGTTTLQSLAFQEAKTSTGYGLDFFEILPNTGSITPATLLGAFNLDAAGNLSYQPNVSSVPEPSTYAAVFGGLSLIAAAIVRRRA